MPKNQQSQQQSALTFGPDESIHEINARGAAATASISQVQSFVGDLNISNAGIDGGQALDLIGAILDRGAALFEQQQGQVDKVLTAVTDVSTSVTGANTEYGRIVRENLPLMIAGLVAVIWLWSSK